MVIYSNNVMVEYKHIQEIDKQLKELGSKVKESLLDEQEHNIASILDLACGSGAFGISLDKINNIQTNEFKIEYKCENSITGPRI